MTAPRLMAVTLAAAVALTAVVVAVSGAETVGDARTATDGALAAERSATDAELAALQARIAELEASLSPTPPPPTTTPPPSPSPSPSPSPPSPGPCVGIAVASGANVQAAITAAPTGATLCLSGSFGISAPLRPKTGQSLVGPAHIFAVGAVLDGIMLKTGAGIGAVNVTIQGLRVSGFGDAAIVCWRGARLLGNELDHNGENGIGCGLEDGGPLLIEGNSIHDNGDTAFVGQGAAAIKVARGHDVVIRGNRVERNIGNGIWCDLECHAVTIEGNEVLGQTRKGIHFEVSRGPALVLDNTVMFNNCAPTYWPDPRPACALPDGTYGPQGAGSPGGGITTNSSCPAASTACVIRGNRLGGNMVAGINFRDDGRPEGGTKEQNGPGCCVGYDVPFNILVEGNVLGGDRLLNCSLAGITCGSNT